MIYEPCHTSSDEVLFGVKGPGNGLGYYAWYLYPQNTFTTWEEAEKAARLMNLAFAEGKAARSREIKGLIG